MTWFSLGFFSFYYLQGRLDSSRSIHFILYHLKFLTSWSFSLWRSLPMSIDVCVYIQKRQGMHLLTYDMPPIHPQTCISHSVSFFPEYSLAISSPHSYLALALPWLCLLALSLVSLRTLNSATHNCRHLFFSTPELSFQFDSGCLRNPMSLFGSWWGLFSSSFVFPDTSVFDQVALFSLKEKVMEVQLVQVHSI